MRAPHRRPEPTPKGAVTTTVELAQRLGDDAWWRANAPDLEVEGIESLRPSAGDEEDAARYGVELKNAIRNARVGYLIDTGLVVGNAFAQTQA